MNKDRPSGTLQFTRVASHTVIRVFDDGFFTFFIHPECIYRANVNAYSAACALCLVNRCYHSKLSLSRVACLRLFQLPIRSASIHEGSILINPLRAMISTPYLIVKLAKALECNLLRPDTSLIISPVLMSDCKVQLAFKKDLPYTQQNHDNHKHQNHNNDDKRGSEHNPSFYHR